MRRIIFLSFFILLWKGLYSQKKDLKTRLYGLEDRIIAGDIEALKEMAKFIDDKTFVQEFLGYHNYPNTARGIAVRAIEENCLFIREEFQIDSSISTAKFLKVINDNKIIFDDLTGRFLITDLTRRTTAYQLKQLSDYDLQRIDTNVIQSPFPGWYYENQIDGFLVTKNPEALKWIASAWYKKRPRFNRYYFNDGEFLDLMKKLSNVDLGVPDESNKITFLYKDDYYAKARLNYLIYWANHFNDYKWSEEKGYFENLKDSAKGKTREEILFSLLRSENDSIAVDAFSQLAELDTGRVKSLAEEYERNNADHNFSIPIFPYRFLKQMVYLTRYCRVHGIKYKADGWLLDSLNKLKTNLKFSDRYRIENSIIERLKLDDITAVEYFGLIYEKEWASTYSIGRILDKFYSRKWKELVLDRENLELYLKKTKLFNELGIVGICNKYVRKFENCSKNAIGSLKSILNETADWDVKQLASMIISSYSVAPTNKKKGKKVWEGNNEKYGVVNLNLRFERIKASKKGKDDKKYDMQKLFGEVSYQQLGDAIKILRRDTSLGAYDKFHFIESDFGFDIDIEDSLALEEFLTNYFSKTEYQLYEYYLRETGMNCFDSSGNLYFPGIYDVLKYNVVDAFVGGGGGRRDVGVYLIIKLLELKLKTTLGFPKKLCSWQGIYGCDCGQRTKAWMHFLEEKKFVVPGETEPPSISYNE